VITWIFRLAEGDLRRQEIAKNIRLTAPFSWTIHGQNKIKNEKGLKSYNLSP